MKTIGKLTLILALLFALAAIWIPAHWWQLLLTALLALFVGAAIIGRKDQP